MAESATKGGEVPGTMYAFEIPSMQPGNYEIRVSQTIEALGQTKQLTSMQPLRVKATSPYALPPALVQAYYPPNMHTVSASTLPHIVLKGATPWERSPPSEPGSAPVPWLALLLFTPDELCAPVEVLGPTIRPSGTMAVTLPLDLINSLAPKFCLNRPFPSDEVAVAKDSQASASFIFVSGKAFKPYFERQDKSKASGDQIAADLDRYKHLAHITDTQLRDADGHPTTKLGTIVSHRIRPYPQEQSEEPVRDEEQTVHAHLVSLEGLDARINWDAASSDAAVVPLVSLYSWTFKWDKLSVSDTMGMFKALSLEGNIRSLQINLASAPDVPAGKARDWMTERLEEGYTIVRHRDIAGEACMALYRGPLTPKRSLKAHIRPSMHGTDMQIIDVGAKMLDVSYSVAWELGRSLAGRDAKFSSALSSLRQTLCKKAVTGARTASQEVADVVHEADDLVDSVLKKLGDLFKGSVAAKLDGLPTRGREMAEQNAKRWKVPKATTVPVVAVPAVMTHAKLRRHLKDFAKASVDTALDEMCASGSGSVPPVSKEIPELPAVLTWVVQNLMSLKLVPALYLFPDPGVLAEGAISSFLIDDTWVDALVDGALSVANSIGGVDDPVRDQIRAALNTYLTAAALPQVPVGGSGFVLRSGLVQSFPDLEIAAETMDSQPRLLPFTFQSKHDDMILCLVARGDAQKLVNYKIAIRLPSHQQCFTVEDVTATNLEFTFSLESFCNGTPAANEDHPGSKVKWDRHPAQEQLDPSAAQPLLNWDTGVLAPHVIVDNMDRLIDNVPAKTYKKVETESRSLYLATQLKDTEHEVLVPFKVEPAVNLPRQVFPEHETPETYSRDKAVFHDPQQNATPPAPGPPTLLTSYFTKMAFSLAFPGKSIAAQSDPPQQLVFAVKATAAVVALPKLIEVLLLEFTIPLGEDAEDLLDPAAPIPIAKAVGSRSQWIAATYRKSKSELVIRMQPRGESGVDLVPGVDASFVLSRAATNGVLGDDVVISSREVYLQKNMATQNGKEVVTSTDKIEVEDSWIVSKQ